MKRIQTILMICCAAAMLSGCLSAMADPEATPTDLQEQVAVQEEQQPEAATDEAEPEEIVEAEISEEPENAAPADEPGEAEENREPENAAPADEPGEAEELVVIAEAIPAEEPVQMTEPETDPEQELLDAGYIKVTVIRENGTNLYYGMDDRADIAGRLEMGTVIWARPQGSFWAEEMKENPKDRPVYFNLNNTALLLGEIGYDLPMRKVTLKSTLDGMTEIEEGTEVTLTAKYKGFQGDEICEIHWQYRPEDDPAGEFRDIDGADGFTYSYQVNNENIHHEWRIILVLKP